MDYNDFLDIKEEVEEEKQEKVSKIGQNQFLGIVTSKKPDWQNIIYDLIHSEELDPWDIDIVILTNKYFEKIEKIDDFYISSKVLLAASLLLRIKSEFLLNKHLRSIDEVLFGKKEEKETEIEKIEVDEDELPILVPKTPLPRAKRVTLNELMSALNKAINTESRRIKREVNIKRAHKLSHISIPEFKRIDLKDRIKQFYAKILTSIKREKELNKVKYSNLIGREREEKLASFLPLLHLSNSQKIWLEQENHLEEIWIYLYEHFSKNKESFMEDLEEDIEEMKEELEDIKSEENESGLEKARRKMKEKKELTENVAKELEKELGMKIEDVKKEEEIDKITGFEDSL